LRHKLEKTENQNSVLCFSLFFLWTQLNLITRVSIFQRQKNIQKWFNSTNYYHKYLLWSTFTGFWPLTLFPKRTTEPTRRDFWRWRFNRWRNLSSTVSMVRTSGAASLYGSFNVKLFGIIVLLLLLALFLFFIDFV
jgi:hypothetical protein